MTVNELKTHCFGLAFVLFIFCRKRWSLDNWHTSMTQFFGPAFLWALPSCIRCWNKWNRTKLSCCGFMFSKISYNKDRQDIPSWISAYFFYNILQMLKKLSKQLSGEDWTWNNLNTLCWAIGSISGSMMEEQVCL